MTVCAALHDWANSLPLFQFPFEESAIPWNGIYLLFERGEVGHGSNRIVRVGTHTGKNHVSSSISLLRTRIEAFSARTSDAHYSTAIMTHFCQVGILIARYASQKPISLSTWIVNTKLSLLYRNTFANIFRSWSSALKIKRIA
jgi:hypothetical protein